jgi:hypothetical protein
METSFIAPRAEAHDGGLPRLSRAQFFGVLALGIALFLFEAGPVWRHPWEMARVDGAIFWSYVLIPLLVLACLAWSRRLSLRAFFLDTLALVLLKYVATCTLALVLWETTPFRPAAAAPPPRHAAAAAAAQAEPAATSTPLDPARTGTVAGTVSDAAGRPAASALVWIAAGLEDHVFAPPAAPVSFVNTGAGMTPPLAVVQAGQPLSARSADGQLHTMVAVKDERTLFNLPLLASGAPSHTSFREAEGLVTLRCNVHPGHAEAEGRVLVLDHPFFAWTDETGHFALHGVPAGRVRLAAYAGGRGSAEEGIDVAPGAAGRAALTVGAAGDGER